MARSESRISETDNRIRIAEAMGIDHGPNYGQRWFDPYESDADCMALVKWLNGEPHHCQLNMALYRGGQWHIVITGAPPEYKKHGWAGDDYKQGVVELALKVVGDE